MRVWNRIILGIVSILAVGCAENQFSGPVQARMILPTGARCQYEVREGTLQTLTSLSDMRGAIGQVVYNSENVQRRPEILDSGVGFTAVDSQFSKRGNVFSPLDFESLFAVSLYHAVETGYRLFRDLDPAADMVAVVPNFGENTRIVHRARRTFGDVGVDPEITDNAEFLGHRVGSGDAVVVKNYLFSFPSDEVDQLPLGLNTGIMVHEYSHLIMHHLFYEPAFKADLSISTTLPTKNTLSSMDEGLADYFGFLATGDPSFFLCSFPTSNRDLGVPKSFTAEIIARIEGDGFISPHEGGAVFAAINYEIGQTIGHEENGRSLIQMIRTLKDCPDASRGANTIGLDFGIVARCHARASSRSATVTSVYQKYLGSYGR